MFTNKCKNLEFRWMKSTVINDPNTRKIPQTTINHLQIRRFVLNDWWTIDIILKIRSICLWENTASYRSAAPSAMRPTATSWQIESFCLSSRSWFNTFNVNPNYQKLKEYYLIRLTIITPDAIIPILIFFLCSLELNNKKLYVIDNKNMIHHSILTYLSYMIHVVFYLKTNCCLNFDLRSVAMLFASITKQTTWKKNALMK